MKRAIFSKNVIFSTIFYKNDLDLSKLKVKVILIFLQSQIPYGKHIWNIKLYERQGIIIITKMATIDMPRLFFFSWPLTLTFKLLKQIRNNHFRNLLVKMNILVYKNPD